MPFSNPVLKNSPAFNSQSHRLLSTRQDTQKYFRELTRLARQQIAYEVMQARKQKSWSQQALANKIGTTQAVISRIEQGRVNLGVDLMVRLKSTLDIVTFV